MKTSSILTLATCFMGSVLAYEDVHLEEQLKTGIIHEHGYWHGEKTPDYHYTDHALSRAICDFLTKEQAKTVIDFGCGMGEYVFALREAGIDATGVDGNPATADFTGGVCTTLDLAEEQDLGKTFDWVISLEVGEHLPKEFEQIFISNLSRHAAQGIILSWGDQGGFGHFNCQPKEYIATEFVKLGYILDFEATDAMRKKAKESYFRKNLLVLRRMAQ